MTRLFLIACLLVGISPSFAQTALIPYRLDKMMGTPVGSPRDVAIDQWGNIYLADGVGVNKLDSTGRFMATFRSASAMARVEVLALDAAGNIYTGSTGTSAPDDVIRKYDPNGQLLMHCGTNGYGAGQMGIVSGLCVGPTGTIYVGDSNKQLFRFNQQGVQLPELIPPSMPNSYSLQDVDVDAAGNLYLLYDNYVVNKLSPTGQLLAQIGLDGATGAPVSSYGAEVLLLDAMGNMLVSKSQGSIVRYSPTGVVLDVVNQNFSGSTHTAMAFDRSGNLYATVFTHQTFSDHLYKFAGVGALRKRWGNLTSLQYVRQDEAGNTYTYDGQTVRKYNAAGQSTLTFSAPVRAFVGGFALDASGNIYVLGSSDTAAELIKYNAQGQQLQRLTSFGFPQNYQSFNGLAVASNGAIYLSDKYGHRIRWFSPQGVLLGTIGEPGLGAGQFLMPRAVAVDLAGNVYVADNDGQRVQKFTAAGQVIRQFGPSPLYNSISVGPVDLDVDGRGNVYVASYVHSGKIFAADGSSETAMPSYGTAVSVNRRATRLLSLSSGSDVVRFFVPTQQPSQNLISGQLYDDQNQNCQRDPNEPVLPNIAVVAEPGGYYGRTDENGSYVLAVDTGRYEVRTLLPPDEVGRKLLQTCAPARVIAFHGYNGLLENLDFGFQVSTRPFLRVNVSSNRRRRCFRNTTTVGYSNDGYAPAPNVAVVVTLPPEVVLISAGAPFTRDAQGRYVFQLGTLPAQTGGVLFLQDSVVCGIPDLRGRTVCTQATITPRNTYLPPPTWNQASVTVQGAAQPGNQVRFVLRNSAAAAMTDSLALRLYQNGELSLQHRYRLAAGDSLVFRVPATRPVVRLEADQPAGHPTQRVASRTVEVRGLSTPGQANPSMLTMPPNEPGPEMAEDCQPILDSYDPNDKQVVPTGVTVRHLTPRNVPLHYQVRFQNTGTDDAYRVEVVDTLASDLDLRTLRLGAASHPYRLAVTGHGRPVLTFTFDNLNLPPSSRDPVGSNGFVQFSIEPKSGLASQTLIANAADIFFDYNPPVRTNATLNRIYDQPPVVVPAVALSYEALLASPALALFTPTQGRAGTLVTLTGQRFATTAVANTVRFNGVEAPVLSATPTALTVRVPATATTGPVVVSTAEGAGRSAQIFTVHQPPGLTAIDPAEGIPGSLVTLTGLNFAPLAAQDTVWFNTTRAVVLRATATTLQVTVPAGATTGKIRLQTLGGTVESPLDFTVWYPPMLLSLSPTTGKAGDAVILTGSNFAPAARNVVSFGPGVAPVLLVSGATSLQVRVPVGAQTGPLQLQTPGGIVQSTASFTFLPAPVITALRPTQASVGEMVQLTGANFLVAARPDSVFFGGTAAVVLAATTTTATVRVPKGAQSGPLTVSGAGGRTTGGPAFSLMALSAAEAIVVYPNPARGRAVLDWQRADFGVEQVRVYNATGSLVTTQELRNAATSLFSLSFASWQPGLYVLVIETSRGRVLKRITLY